MTSRTPIGSPISWLLTGFLVAAISHSLADPRPKASHRLAQVIEATTLEEGFSGAVLVWIGDTTLLRQGHGSAVRELGSPNRPETRFEIASITKHFVATLTFLLIEDGLLDEETRVGDIVSEAPSNSARITVDQLVHHTSGLPSYTQWESWRRLSREPVSRTEFAKLLLEQPLEFEPGSDFAYSNSGYYVLGVLLERITGRPLDQLLEESVFARSEMAATSLMTAPSPPADASRARGYERLENGRILPVAPLVPSRSFSAGAVVSTVDDLHRWSRFVQTGGLPPAVTSKLLAAGRGNYGGGLLSAKVEPRDVQSFLDAPFTFRGTSEGCRITWHWGSNPGFNSLLMWIGDEAGLVLLENLEDLELERGTRLFELAGALVQELAKEPYADAGGGPGSPR